VSSGRNSRAGSSTSGTVLLLALLCATALTWERRTWPPLLAYGTVLVLLAVAQSGFYHSKLRLLIPVMLFLVPVANVLARSRTRTAVIVLSAVTLFGCWYGAYMLTTWHYAI
jgi:hypothetical protein